MLIFLFGVGSVYVFYGYVTPYLEQVLGMGTVQASTTLMAYGVFCLISNILGGWIDARFGMKALLVTFVLQAAALFGLFAVGDALYGCGSQPPSQIDGARELGGAHGI